MPPSQKQAPQVQTTKTKLGPEQKQLFDLTFPKLQEYAASGPPLRYTGQTIAGFDPSQTAGQELALGAAGTQGQILGNANASNAYWNSPNVWDPANNAGLRGAIDAATRPISQAYTNEYLPALRSEAIKTGGLGGSRQGVFEALGAEKTSRAIGDTSAKLVQDLYKTNVDAQLKSQALAPTLAGAATMPATTTSAVGDVRQAQDQAHLNEAANAFTYDQIAPWLQTKELMSMIQGIPGATTISTATNPPSAEHVHAGAWWSFNGCVVGRGTRKCHTGSWDRIRCARRWWNWRTLAVLAEIGRDSECGICSYRGWRNLGVQRQTWPPQWGSSLHRRDSRLRLGRRVRPMWGRRSNRCSRTSTTGSTIMRGRGIRPLRRQHPYRLRMDLLHRQRRRKLWDFRRRSRIRRQRLRHSGLVGAQYWDAECSRNWHPGCSPVCAAGRRRTAACGGSGTSAECARTNALTGDFGGLCRRRCRRRSESVSGSAEISEIDAKQLLQLLLLAQGSGNEGRKLSTLPSTLGQSLGGR